MSIGGVDAADLVTSTDENGDHVFERKFNATTGNPAIRGVVTDVTSSSYTLTLSGLSTKPQRHFMEYSSGIDPAPVDSQECDCSDNISLECSGGDCTDGNDCGDDDTCEWQDTV